METISRRSFIKQTAAAGGLLLATPYLEGRDLFASSSTRTGYFGREFGIDEGLCAKLIDIALSRGGDFADLYFEHNVGNWLMLKDGRVSQSHTTVKLGVGIRSVKGDQVGYGYTEELTPEAMAAAARTAASLTDGPATAAVPALRSMKHPDFYPLRNTDQISLDRKLPLVRTIDKRCFESTPAVVKVMAGFQDSLKRIMVVTSEGTVAEDTIPRNLLFASVVGRKNGRMEQSNWRFGGRYDFSFYSEDMARQLADEAVKRLLTQFNAVAPPAGEMPVVLGPGVTGILLHEAIGHGMEADFNRKKISIYSDMLGKKVAEPFVTIIDDGTINHQVGSINVDDEGSPSQKTVLVDKGILTSYMHDKISARHYGVSPTGNGRRESYAHYPMPRMRNTYMLAGEETPEGLVRKAKNGIYIEDVTNGQVKIGEGDFAFYVSRGRMIEDGKLTAPIKDINIMGNGPKMLTNIIAVANDLKLSGQGGGNCGKNGQTVPVSFGLPSCLVKSMTVGGIRKQGGPA